MQYVLWVCLVSSAGLCATERAYVYPTQQACTAALSSARVESSGAVSVTGSATSIEVVKSDGQRVLMLCRPK